MLAGLLQMLRNVFVSLLRLNWLVMLIFLFCYIFQMLILLFSDTNYIRDGFVAEYYVTDCPKNCSSHGMCVNHECKCHSMWSSPACDLDLCPGLCGESEGHGSCQMSGGVPHCVCNGGYSGQSCDLPRANRGSQKVNRWYRLAEEGTGLSGRAGHAGVYLAQTDGFYVFGG